MSQNDFNIANQGFPATRADINSALQALASNSAGTAEPSTTYAYQFWYDETNELLKMRNSDNDAWITIGSFDQATDTFTPEGVTTDKIEEGNSSVEVVDTGTGYVAITVDGVEAARVDANGRLGIATTSPQSSLHVAGAITNSPTGDGIHMGMNGNYAQIQLNATNHTIDFSTSGTDFAGRIGYLSATNVMQFYTNGSEAMRINSSGNVGIGTTSPSTLAHLKGSGDFAALTIETATTGGASYINLGDSGDQDVGQIAYYNSDDSLRVKVNAAERARINSSGQVLVSDVTRTYGNTSSPLYSAGNSDATSGAIPLELAVASGSGGFRYLAGFSNVSGFIGSISVSGSTTSYNTTSDYRLKENVTPLNGAASRLAQIPVHRFNFISDPETTVDGFLAHEVQAIVPEAVHGEKDAVNAEGQPEYQGIDQSKLVPLLTAALQEALTEIESLKARVAALEGA